MHITIILHFILQELFLQGTFAFYFALLLLFPLQIFINIMQKMK